ncbi:MAG: hypothetical protein ACRCYS_19545 [Beijerinckiaceae bacterium]
MAHPETPEAVDAPATLSMADAAAVFGEEFEGEEALDDESTEEGENQAEDGEDVELEAEDGDDEEGEPETAIAPPVSLTAEEKAEFAQLDEEAQRFAVKLETRRNAQVQEATTKAANAQREAEARAASADADAKAKAANKVLEFIADYQPVEPKREWYADDVSYLTACRQYDNENAQFLQKVQRAVDMEAEAETEADAAFIAQRDRELSQHPQIANPETRDTYVKGILELAADVGLDPAVIAKQATGSEFLALAQVFDRLQAAEAKAGKWDKAVAKQMQKVRSAKGKTLRPNAAQSNLSSGERASQQAMQAFRFNPSSRQAAAAVFEDI